MIGKIIKTNEVWPKETPENREMMRCLKRVWRDFNELKNSTKIEIRDKNSQSALIGKRVEEYLDSNAVLKNHIHQSANMSRLANQGVFSDEGRIYEIENEGKIKYTRAHNPGIFAADIVLIGFDKRRKIYKKLEKDLGDVARLEPNTMDYLRVVYYGIGNNNPRSKEDERYLKERLKILKERESVA